MHFSYTDYYFQTNKLKLEQELCEASSKEAALIAKIGQVEGLNKDLSCNITVEKNKSDCLTLSLEEGTRKMASLKEELVSKCMALEELQNEMKISRNQLEVINTFLFINFENKLLLSGFL